MAKGLSPHEPGEITLPWLSRVLQKDEARPASGIRTVEAEKIDNGSGYSGEIARWRLQYDDLATGRANSVIVKSANRNPIARAMMLPLNVREVLFYQQLASQVGFSTPHCYYAAANRENGAALLLLEDLAHCTFPSDDAGCTYQVAESLMTHLARFHAQWWDNSRLAVLDWLPVYMTNPERDHLYFRQLWPNFVAQFGDHVPAPFLALGFTLNDHFRAIYQALFNLMAQPPHTLQHGDFRLNNLAIHYGIQGESGEEERKRERNSNGNGQRGAEFYLFDWHTLTIGRGAFDVARFLVTSLTVNDRRAWEPNLLRLYHNVLQENGVSSYPFEDCLRDVQIAVIQNLIHHVVASVVLNLTSADALAMHHSVGQRLSALIEDHELLPFVQHHALNQ